MSACTQPGSPGQCDPQALRAVRSERSAHAEVTVCGTVLRAGTVRRSRSGTHREFIVITGRNDRVAIDANLDIMGDLPVRAGERAIVHGEYFADASGRDGLHWTHRTSRGTHPPGYIVLNGTMYQ